MVSKKLSRASFAAAVKMHRERLALSQADAATLLDVSPRTLWQWENEERDTLLPTQIGALEILKFAKKK